MTRALMLLPFLLLLAACVPSGNYAPPAIDPHSRLALADNVQREAQAQIRATEQRLASLGEEAAAVSTRIAAEVMGEAAMVELKKTDVALDLERVRPTQTFEAAMLSWYSESTQAAALAPQTTATAQALYAASAKEEQSIRHDNIRAWLLTISLTAGAVLISIGVYKLLRAWEEVIWRRSGVVLDPHFGPVVYQSNGQYEILGVIKREPLRLPRSIPDLNATVSPNRVYATSAPDRRIPADSEVVGEFIHLAEERMGEMSNQFPGWRDLPGWTRDKWQRAVGPLKAAGVLETVPSKGTYVTEQYKTLDNVRFAWETGRIPIALSPTPREDD
jgi:hypothetical protein